MQFRHFYILHLKTIDIIIHKDSHNFVNNKYTYQQKTTILVAEQ